MWADSTQKMAQGDGYHNTMYMVGGVHLPVNLPLFPEEDFEPRGDGFVPRSTVPIVLHNARPEEPNQAERQVAAFEPNAGNEDPFQPAGPLLPMEPLAHPDDFFLLYDYETDESELEESELEDDDGEHQEDGNNETVLQETLSEVSNWKNQGQWSGRKMKKQVLDISAQF